MLPVPDTPFGGHSMHAKGGKPANLPDLCVIAHVFGRWSENVYKRRPTTVVELKKICEAEWVEIDEGFIQKIYIHMKKVYPWVVANGGKQIPSSK